MNPAPEPIRVLCADDHPLVLEGLKSLIGRQPDMHLVASTGTAEDTVALYGQHQPDVALIDLQMPIMGGLEAIRVIRGRWPAARIVVLTTYQGDEHIFQALRAGAATYLLKETLTVDLVRIVREVYGGGRPMSPMVEASLADREVLGTLTTRETQIVALIARGFRNSDIALEVGISEETVKVHVKHILAKLHVTDRGSAVTTAVRRGIIQL